MNPPLLSFRATSSSYGEITSFNYYTSDELNERFYVLGGTDSDKFVFRLYNNFEQSTNIGTAYNIRITTYDGIGAISRTALKSITAQQWLHIGQWGFGESTTIPGLLTFYEGSMYCVGGSGYYAVPERTSDGRHGNELRAGSNGNGVGFIEWSSFMRIPEGAPAGIHNFAITVHYEYVL